MNDQAIEQEIQAKGLTAPRITPADIEENIVGEFYFTAGSATRGASMEQVAEVAHEVNRAYCQALESGYADLCAVTINGVNAQADALTTAK